MAISTPMLPPKRGYVERVNSDGEHYYQPTPETAEKLAKEAEAKETEALTLELEADHEARLCAIELGV